MRIEHLDDYRMTTRHWWLVRVPLRRRGPRSQPWRGDQPFTFTPSAVALALSRSLMMSYSDM